MHEKSSRIPIRHYRFLSKKHKEKGIYDTH